MVSSSDIELKNTFLPLSTSHSKMNDFVRSWKIAGDEMERLRNKRLHDMAPEAGVRMMGAVEPLSREDMYANGLARWQSWMMRWRLQNLLKQVSAAASNAERPIGDA